MENIIASIMALGVTIAVDYLHTENMSYVSSAVPILIFQLLIMLHEKIRDETGMGLIRFCWQKFFGNNANDQE